MKWVSLRCRGGILALDLGGREDADGTSARRRGAGRRDECAGSDFRIEDRAGDPHLSSEVAGKRQMVSRVGHDLDDGPERGVGADRETHS